MISHASSVGSTYHVILQVTSIISSPHIVIMIKTSPLSEQFTNHNPRFTIEVKNHNVIKACRLTYPPPLNQKFTIHNLKFTIEVRNHYLSKACRLTLPPPLSELQPRSRSPSSSTSWAPAYRGRGSRRSSVICLFSTVLYVPVDFTIDYQINIFHHLFSSSKVLLHKFFCAQKANFTKCSCRN